MCGPPSDCHIGSTLLGTAAHFPIVTLQETGSSPYWTNASDVSRSITHALTQPSNPVHMLLHHTLRC